MRNSRYSIKDLCSIAIFTAVTAVMAQISIPMPIGVPVTMQTFAVTLAAVILGSRNGMISMIIYIFLGMVGVPVFANLGGGLYYIIGPTGGFLISFPIMAWLIGWGTEHKKKNWVFIIMLILGTTVNFIIGAVFFCFVTNSAVIVAMTSCVFPFLPVSILKAAGAAVLGMKLRRRLGIIL